MRAELAGDLKDKNHFCNRVMKMKLVTSGRLLKTEVNFRRISLKGVLTSNQTLILFTWLIQPELPVKDQVLTHNKGTEQDWNDLFQNPIQELNKTEAQKD